LKDLENKKGIIFLLHVFLILKLASILLKVKTWQKKNCSFYINN